MVKKYSKKNNINRKNNINKKKQLGGNPSVGKKTQSITLPINPVDFYLNTDDVLANVEINKCLPEAQPKCEPIGHMSNDDKIFKLTDDEQTYLEDNNQCQEGKILKITTTTNIGDIYLLVGFDKKKSR